MKSKQLNRKLIFILLALLLLVITVISGRGFSSAFAGTSRYKSALTDLQTDSKFNVADYPENYEDTSIYVIQVAESEDGELFIYTYQPCQNTIYLVATEINMSLSDSVNGTKIYKLTLCNISGVFGKYVVNDFTVGSAKTRYYNISTIYRPSDKILDGPSYNNNKSRGFEVGQLWTAVSMNDTVYYSMETVDVLEIRNCVYGSIRVPNGYNWLYSYSCDMHIIAFSTDIKMDNLLEADVAFDYRSVDKSMYGTDYGEWQSNTVTVTYKESSGTSGSHPFHSVKRTWDKIQSSSDFLNTMTSFGIEASDKIRDDIKKTDWVLAFWDTPYVDETGGALGWLTWIGNVFGNDYMHYTQITDATVIRLEYIKDGVTYNVGVVSDKSGDYEVVGGGDETFGDTVEKFFTKTLKNFFNGTIGGLKLWHWLLIAVAVIVVIVIIVKLVRKKKK